MSPWVTWIIIISNSRREISFHVSLLYIYIYHIYSLYEEKRKGNVSNLQKRKWLKLREREG